MHMYIQYMYIVVLLLAEMLKWASVPAYPKLWQFFHGQTDDQPINHELLGHPAIFIHNITANDHQMTSINHIN